ncbi:RNA polymerase sigma-70 factor [Pedobacter sp. KR3-3]|uniref:RNA polymerase sigma-70 factor n=1 Tax=Pedobacter albus TaxID=3113905 RepID=A0ABU7I446_9SPHI|nr:RNA polymerase sigma-70 factor [Pedobacter sp. KR3-3]MEE1944198.1 RNA polymerase sigma-70 factor [Pedobacter sp. KR3-3]
MITLLSETFTYASNPDQALVELLIKGDALAYTAIYNRYFDVLYLHARKRLGDNEEAQDLLQDLFAALWNKRAELQLKSNLKAYLYVAVRNKVLDVISHKQVADKYINSLQRFIDEGYAGADHLIRERQLKELIEKGIAGLSPRMREIFELSRNHCLTYRQIAEQLGISEQNVKTQIKLALKKLRKELGLMLCLAL